MALHGDRSLAGCDYAVILCRLRFQGEGFGGHSRSDLAGLAGERPAVDFGPEPQVLGGPLRRFQQGVDVSDDEVVWTCGNLVYGSLKCLLDGTGGFYRPSIEDLHRRIAGWWSAPAWPGADGFPRIANHIGQKQSRD